MATIIDGTTGSSIAGNTTVTGNLTVTGIITAGAGTAYALNAYVAPATWTKPVGLKAVKVTVVGSGGNGGGSTATAPAPGGRGGGGGGGGAAIEYLPAASIPGPVAVTAGAGTNSFGAFCSATAGGNGGNGTSPGGSGAGGAGGTGSGGQVNLSGSQGYGIDIGSDLTCSGGTSQLFSGLRFIDTGTSGLNGLPNNAIGGGGTGATVRNAGTGTGTGGTGGPGIVIIEEFY
jgi:hypothetical protein